MHSKRKYCVTFYERISYFYPESALIKVPVYSQGKDINYITRLYLIIFIFYKSMSGKMTFY